MATPSVKACRDCGRDLPLSQFYRHQQMADGRLNKCMDCVKARVKRHRDANLDRIRAYDRARGNRQTAADVRASRERYPEKYRARLDVANALSRGDLVRHPCEKCGSDEHIHAHHDDYSRPLDVRWLCRACHWDEHRA